MSDWNTGGDGWGNNTTQVVNDEWNTSSGDAGAANFHGGDPVADFNREAEGPVDDYRPNAQGGCFNCGEEGHNRADCPQPQKPREFTGDCRSCGQSGHRASDCLNKPKFCRQCKAENDHDTIDCKEKMLIDRSSLPDCSEDDAWAMLKDASDDFDAADAREAINVLFKANPDTTYLQIEKELRKRNLKIFLVGLKKEVAKAFTNVDLDGTKDREFTLGIFRSATCSRPVMIPTWPKDAAENLVRLENTGVPIERGIPTCTNCGELGHVRKNCTQELDIAERVKIHCVLCEEDGHRMRDCPNERPQPRAARLCKFCESPDHIAKECPEKPAELCRNCFQEGHRAGDCTNERVMKCRNCDEIGHAQRECPAPKDWSRVECRHCGEKGHGSSARCAPGAAEKFAAAKAAEEAANGDNGDNGDHDNPPTTEANDAWNDTAIGNGTSGQSGWEMDTTPVAVAAGGGGW